MFPEGNRSTTRRQSSRRGILIEITLLFVILTSKRSSETRWRGYFADSNNLNAQSLLSLPFIFPKTNSFIGQWVYLRNKVALGKSLLVKSVPEETLLLQHRLVIYLRNVLCHDEVPRGQSIVNWPGGNTSNKVDLADYWIITNTKPVR